MSPGLSRRCGVDRLLVPVRAASSGACNVSSARWRGPTLFSPSECRAVIPSAVESVRRGLPGLSGGSDDVRLARGVREAFSAGRTHHAGDPRRGRSPRTTSTIAPATAVIRRERPRAPRNVARGGLPRGRRSPASSIRVRAVSRRGAVRGPADCDQETEARRPGFTFHELASGGSSSPARQDGVNDVATIGRVISGCYGALETRRACGDAVAPSSFAADRVGEPRPMPRARCAGAGRRAVTSRRLLALAGAPAGSGDPQISLGGTLLPRFSPAPSPARLAGPVAETAAAEATIALTTTLTPCESPRSTRADIRAIPRRTFHCPPPRPCGIIGLGPRARARRPLGPGR